jgi:filamentous hemagglutinin family protein
VFDWGSFNIGSNGAVNFNQTAGASSITANRVPGATSASVINGLLSAPGNVMILNAHGVIFGATARVNVAGLIASTGDLKPDSNFTEFMGGGSFSINGANAGSIINQGEITISNAGLAAFVAPSLSNSGTITASGGRIVLANADTATISLNGIYEIALNAGSNINASITNSGALSAAGGTIVLSARDAANIVSGVINLEGIQQASGIEVHGGKVVLKSDLNATTVTGTSRDIEVCNCAQIQDAVDIARVGTAPGTGATVTVDGGVRAEQVIIDKAYLTLSGTNNATVTIAPGQTAFNIAADGVTVEDMKIVGPYSQAYTAVNWGAEPDVTAAFTIQPNVTGATIRDNDIRNVRAGVLMLGNAPSARITGNLIDNTKGSILVRSNGATISGNRFGPVGNEWDIVFLNGVTDGEYFRSPHDNVQQYGDEVMAMSAANNGMHILDRRYGSNGLLASTPQFGNRSHVTVSAGSTFDADDDFNLGNGLGNARQPLGFIADAINAVVDGGFIDLKAGTYTQSSTLNVNKSVTLTGAGEGQTIIDSRSVSGYGMLVTADDVSLSEFTLRGPQANAGTSYGIKVQPGGSAASDRLRRFSISHVTSRGAGRAELDLNGVEGATINHFTALGEDTAGAGIQITDSTNVTISNSTTEGNRWGGVALFQANRFFDQQVSNITVQSNNIFSEANPLYMQDESASQNFGTNLLQGFQYAVRNSSSTNANNQYTWLQYGLGSAVNLAVAVPAPSSSTIQSWDGTATTQDFHVGAGMSIMQAVNQAAPGANVNVGAGTYGENVVVNAQRNLTFGGAALQSLTVNAAGTGIGGSATANGAGGFTFNAPVVLLSDTSLGTTGANITFNADLQNSGTTPRALTLSAGSGDISMVSGGIAANPLGMLDVAANNFDLTGTMWVSGYDIDALGAVALSDSTLRSVGEIINLINAGGGITGSTVTQGAVKIESAGTIAMTNVVSAGNITLQGSGSVTAGVTTPAVVFIASDGAVAITGSATAVVVSAPSGSVTGNFGGVTNGSSGVLQVNGVPQVPLVIPVSRIVPPESTLMSNAPLVMDGYLTSARSGQPASDVYFSTREEERRGARIMPAAPAQAGAILELGFGVELDLTPRNTR